MPLVLADEATADDRLGRTEFVQALTSILLKCDTPFVVGIFGDWGTGKTSMLRMLQRSVNKDGVKAVWFDAWLHQDDEWPPIAMLQTLVAQLGLGSDAKRLLSVVGTGFASALVKLGTGLSVSPKDIKALGEAYEEEMFEVREKRIRLRDRFIELVKLACPQNNERLVFFIDDLDRCPADSQVRMLDALRVYLNLPNCVFVIAADRRAIQRAISAKFGKDDHTLINYIDKIVQLPFNVPTVSLRQIDDFTGAILPAELSVCRELIVSGLGANPRSLKRFINILSLHHELAVVRKIHSYDPKTLCVLLLVQYHDYEKFTVVSLDARLFQLYLADAEKDSNRNLSQTLQLYGSKVPKNFLSYVHLTESTGLDITVEINQSDTPPSVAPRKSARKPKASFMQPVTPSQELALIVGSQPQPRTELTKKLWAYIKKNGLQDKANRRMINTDENLRAVVGGKKQVSLFDLTKFVSLHAS